MHDLLHIVDDYARFGPLDHVFCFSFENFLEKLKKMVGKSSNPIDQICRQIEEDNICGIKKNILENKLPRQMQHFEGPLPSGYESFSQFKKYSSSNIFLSSLPGNNCFCSDGSICVIRNIISSSDSTKIVFAKFLTKELFSIYAFDLQLIHIYTKF